MDTSIYTTLMVTVSPVAEPSFSSFSSRFLLPSKLFLFILKFSASDRNRCIVYSNQLLVLTQHSQHLLQAKVAAMLPLRAIIIYTCLPIISVLITLFSLTSSQTVFQPSGGDIDFTTFKDYSNFRACLVEIFAPYLSYGLTVPGQNVGCTTIKCMCQPHLIEQNIPLLYTQAEKGCSDEADASSATSILTEYCKDEGFTDMPDMEAAVTDAGSSKPVTTPKAATAVITKAITTTSPDGSVATITQVVQAPTEEKNAGNQNNDLGPGAIIGIVIGAVTVIIGVIGLWFNRKQLKIVIQQARAHGNGNAAYQPTPASHSEAGVSMGHLHPSVKPQQAQEWPQGGYGDGRPAYLEHNSGDIGVGQNWKAWK